MIEKALAGEEVVITRNGEDVVEIRPIRKRSRKNWIGMYEGQIVIHDDFDAPLDDETLAYFTGEAETFLDKAMRENSGADNRHARIPVGGRSRRTTVKKGKRTSARPR